MGTPVDVSLIVVTFNNEGIIERCLAAARMSVKSHTWELFVVDNGSTDGTVAQIKKAAPCATIIELGENAGFAVANNVAIQRASGRYVALVNSDAFIDPGAVDQLIQRAESDSSIGLVGGKLRDPSGRRQPSAGGFPSLLGNLGVALFWHRLPLLSRLPLSVYANRGRYAKARRVDWVSGAFCLARREVGLLPTAGFMYGEDVEWARQARGRGLETWIEPAATALHMGAGAETVPVAVFRQESRVDFDLRWFSVRGPVAVAGARLVMAIHGLLRIGVFAGLLPLRPAAARLRIAEFWALFRAAVRQPTRVS